MKFFISLEQSVEFVLFSFRFSDENFPNILALVDVLKRIGEKHNATPGQVTLAWVMAQGPNIIPIPGTKKVKVSFLLVSDFPLGFQLTSLFLSI